MAKTAYVWDNIVVATRELEEYLNMGYNIVSSTLYEQEDGDFTHLIFAAVLVHICRTALWQYSQFQERFIT